MPQELALVKVSAHLCDVVIMGQTQLIPQLVGSFLFVLMLPSNT